MESNREAHNGLTKVQRTQPQHDIAVLHEVYGKKVEWYLTIDGMHVVIRADDEAEIEREIDRLTNSGELQARGWDYTEVEDGRMQQGSAWVKFYPVGFYGVGIKQYRWEDFKIEKTEGHIVYASEEVIKKPKLLEEADFERELRAYLTVGEHENVAQFLGVVVSNGVVEGMVFRRYKASGELSVDDLIDLCLGIQHIHSKGIVHGDIHPGNIVREHSFPPEKNARYPTPKLGERQRIRIIDLVCNEYVDRWAAPEVLVGAPQSFKSDVYSIGALCESLGYQMTEALYKEPSKRCDVLSISTRLKMRTQQSNNNVLQ
ncbi:hypothetical protein GGI20_005706 [Coemansia sp. BCRC 34301]|nr:hypothetical protein GGI20_005706 [Coemansia sp. BCRC 34301]